MDYKTQQKIKRLVEKSVDNRHIYGVTTTVLKSGKEFSFSSGNLQAQDHFFVASVTKLYTTAVVYQLIDEGKLMLADTIDKYLASTVTEGLHIFKGKDYSRRITIKHLLSHTSGLPDYFMQKGKGATLFDTITSGSDTSWSFEDTIIMSKSMTPKFAPGTNNKAFYSDTNFQLLGRIIESIDKLALGEVYGRRIFTKLGLKHTYLYDMRKDKFLKKMYFKRNELDIPQAMQSFGADGGMVSTAQDLAVFTQAFFTGKLFDVSHIKSGYEFNRIFFPLKYGTGFMLYKLPRIFSPLKPFPELIGHSGHSGAFAFYDPATKTTICGTVNQINNPKLSFQLLSKMYNVL